MARNIDFKGNKTLETIVYVFYLHLKNKHKKQTKQTQTKQTHTTKQTKQKQTKTQTTQQIYKDLYTKQTASIIYLVYNRLPSNLVYTHQLHILLSIYYRRWESHTYVDYRTSHSYDRSCSVQYILHQKYNQIHKKV